jgi:hypothetical protein
MKHEGAARILKVLGLIAAAIAVLLALQFLLNVTAGERPAVGVAAVPAPHVEREELS